MITRKQICKEVKNRLGVDVEMFSGDGYYYFVGDCLNCAETTMVMTNSLNSLSVESWVFEVSQMITPRDASTP